MKIAYYCINLSKATERRQQCEQLAKAAGIELQFVNAVEGSTIRIDQSQGYQRARRLTYLNDLTLNEIGCIESHRRTLQSFLASDATYAVVLEDDAGFENDLNERLCQLCEHLSGFDFLKIESRSNRGYTIGKLAGLRVFASLKNGFGTTGIVYSRRGAEKVLHSLDSYVQPLDTHLGRCDWQQGWVVVAVEPTLVWERGEHSSIGKRPKNRRRPGLRPFLFDYCEHLRHTLMKRVHAWKTRQFMRNLNRLETNKSPVSGLQSPASQSPTISYFCINLPQSTERRRQIEQLASKADIDLHFVEGVKGSAITVSSVRGYQHERRRRYLDELLPNELGCIESHRHALQAFLKSTATFGVILEDDAEFEKDIASRIRELCACVTGFDLLKIDSCIHRGKTIGDVNGFRVYAPYKGCVGAIGLLFTRLGAEKVIDSLDTFVHPYDTHLGYWSWKIGLNMIAIEPPLVREQASISQIGIRPRRRRSPGLRAYFLDRFENIRHSLMKRIHAMNTKAAVRIETLPMASSPSTEYQTASMSPEWKRSA